MKIFCNSSPQVVELSLFLFLVTQPDAAAEKEEEVVVEVEEVVVEVEKPEPAISLHPLRSRGNRAVPSFLI